MAMLMLSYHRDKEEQHGHRVIHQPRFPTTAASVLASLSSVFGHWKLQLWEPHVATENLQWERRISHMVTPIVDGELHFYGKLSRVIRVITQSLICRCFTFFWKMHFQSQPCLAKGCNTALRIYQRKQMCGDIPSVKVRKSHFWWGVAGSAHFLWSLNI